MLSLYIMCFFFHYPIPDSEKLDIFFFHLLKANWQKHPSIELNWQPLLLSVCLFFADLLI